jgi:hypothetical protein
VVAMLRNLRVAASVLSLMAFLALVTLWVRSYWRADAVSGMYGGHFIYMGTYAGLCGVEVSTATTNLPDRWRAFTQPILSSVQPFAAADHAVDYVGIHWHRYANGWSFSVRFLWLLPLTGALLATLWADARFHYSTGALLAAMTTIALVLGFGGLLFRYLTS